MLSFLNSFSLVTPFGNVDINLDFVCSCQCEKEEEKVCTHYKLSMLSMVVPVKVGRSPE